MKSKFESYLGFARKAGSLVFGTGTCEVTMKRGKVKLLIIAEDTADNSKMLVSLGESMNVTYIVYGLSEELSRIVGASARNAFAVTDENFAEIIRKQKEV